MSSLFYHSSEPFHPWFLRCLRYWGMLKQIAISVNILIFGKIIFSSMLLKILLNGERTCQRPQGGSTRGSQVSSSWQIRFQRGNKSFPNMAHSFTDEIGREMKILFGWLCNWGRAILTHIYEWQTWCFELCGCGVWSGYKTRQFRVMNSSKSDTANKLSICPVGIQLLPSQKWTRWQFFSFCIMTVDEHMQSTQVLMFQRFALFLRLFNINSIYCVRLITWAAEIQEIFHQSVRRQILHSSGGDLVFRVGGACKC